LFALVLVLSFSLVTAAPAAAATLTVDTSLPNTPPNYHTIQAAINAAGTGDTINVAAGTYDEQVTVNKDNLVIQSTDGAATTIINPTDTSAGGIWIQGSGNTFDGFTVRDFSDDSNENKIIRVHSGADNNAIRNNVIQGNLNQVGIADQTEYGILVYGSGTVIESNEIFDIGYMGVNIIGPVHSGGAGSTIANNEVHDIGIYAIGIDRSAANTITQNTIHDLTGGTLWGDYYDPAVWCWYIIIWGESADGNRIIHQDVIGSPNGGIVLSSAHNTILDACDISGNANVGLMVAESSWAGGIPTGNEILSNDIKNNVDGVRIAGTIGTGNVFHYNNIFSNTSYGMNNQTTTVIDALYNWWGDVSGPYDNILAGDGLNQYNPGGLGDSVTEYVLYDPWIGQAGMVTGGGWFDSPEGAYSANPELVGKATFGFIAKNKKDITPEGNTHFVFKTADLNFHSSSYDWLVVNQAGSNAQFKGWGSVNGEDGYRFMLWAGDNDPDTFRIKIWTETNSVETVIYDNGSHQPIEGGNIVVHKK
jgi:hypothetical protein